MLKRVYELMACLVTFDDEIISPCAFYFRRPGSPFSIALDQINFLLGANKKSSLLGEFPLHFPTPGRHAGLPKKPGLKLLES